MEEEEEGKEKMEEEEEEEEKKSDKSTMELLFDYVKEEEKKRDKSKFRFLVKQRNLLNYSPKRNEKLRAGLERVTLDNLLLTIKGKIETLVVNCNAVYTVNVDYNGEKESFQLSLPGLRGRVSRESERLRTRRADVSSLGRTKRMFFKDFDRTSTSCKC